MRHLHVLLLSISLCLMTGCSGVFVDNDQPTIAPDARVLLGPGQLVGQTFVARRAGLNGVEVWLEPDGSTEGEVRLHLLTEPGASDDLAVAAMPMTSITAPGFYTFAFPPLKESLGQYLYITLEKQGPGSPALGESSGNSYLDGALYRDGHPEPAQLAFRPTYARRQVLMDSGRELLSGLGLLAVAGLLYVVPGWALLAWVRRDELLSWPVTLGVAIGLSLALYPVLLLWTDLAGVHLGALYAWLPALGGSAWLLWRYRRWRPRMGWKALRAWHNSAALWPDLALLIILTLSFLVRLVVVRSLEVAMWADSYQHTLMAQLLLDNGGLFHSWEPYVPYQSLTVHFGFPTFAALLSWMTGIASTQATLLTGQLINGLAMVTLYPLSVRIAGGNRWAGVGTVLIASLLSPMPMEYVNWGRFPQLAGQVILPIALWFMWETVDQKRFSPKIVFLAGLCLAGMALTYYRMLFFYATFIFAWGLGWGLPRWKLQPRQWRTVAIRLAAVAGFALIMFLPWQRFMAGGSLVRSVGEGMTKGTPFEIVKEDYRVWLDIVRYVPRSLLLTSLVALAWSLLRRRWVVAAIGLWVLELASLVALRLLHVPATNQMQNFAVVIALYIPVGLLVGWLLGDIVVLAQGWAPAPAQWVSVAAVVALALWGVAGQIKVVNPTFILVTRPDTRAMAWIRENTPPEARFLVEGFRIYDGITAIGADAGWWIPLLAGRQNTMPPQYALMNEAATETGYSQRIVDLVARLETNPPTSPDSLKLLCDSQITHVYIGQRQGKAGPNTRQLFTPEAFMDSPAFERVYQGDLVSIFALDPKACEANTG